MYLWIIAAFTAYFIKGLCGFANTLVFTSILSFGAANANISPVELLIGYPTNFILTWKNRKSLDYKVYLPLAALVLAGCIPGALLLKNADVSNQGDIWQCGSALWAGNAFSGQEKGRGESVVPIFAQVQAYIWSSWFVSWCSLWAIWRWSTSSSLCGPGDGQRKRVQGQYQRRIYCGQYIPDYFVQCPSSAYL